MKPEDQEELRAALLQGGEGAGAESGDAAAQPSRRWWRRGKPQPEAAEPVDAETIGESAAEEPAARDGASSATGAKAAAAAGAAVSAKTASAGAGAAAGKASNAKAGSDKAGTEKAGSEKADGDKATTDKAALDTGTAGKPATDKPAASKATTDTAATEKSAPKPASAAPQKAVATAGAAAAAAAADATGADAEPVVDVTDAEVSDEDVEYDDAPLPGHRIRMVIRGIGEVFITVGVLLLLMVAYQLWWTNVESSQAIAAERQQIEQSWADPDQGAVQPTPTAPPRPVTDKPIAEPPYGTGFALLYIPRLADHVWGLPISEGTGKDILAHGAGHYEDTAMPGGVGNFAIAAHRSSHSEPFANFPDLQVGDKVYVRTKKVWYVYTLTHDDPNLTPSDVWVIEPVPGYPDSTPKKQLLTMTTCTPRYGSTGRWAWWGELTESRYVSDGPPDGIDPTTAPA